MTEGSGTGPGPDPSVAVVDWLFRAWRSGAHLRFHPKVSVFAVPSGARDRSYQAASSPEHDYLAAEMRNNPRFRDTALEIAAISGEREINRYRFARSRADALRALVFRPASAAAISPGIHPHALYFALRHGRRGNVINAIRRRTGLGALAPPGSGREGKDLGYHRPVQPSLVPAIGRQLTASSGVSSNITTTCDSSACESRRVVQHSAVAGNRGGRRTMNAEAMLRNLTRVTRQALCGCCLLTTMAFGMDAQPLTFTTLAGPAGGAGSADGTGSAARFKNPVGVATDGGGNIYVAEELGHTIRKITPAGVVTTLAGSAGLDGSADGTGGAARFYCPTGVAADSGGTVYVAVLLSHTIRKITPAGVVTTLAGSAGLSGSADGIGSAARFDDPHGVATDSGGNVFVADRGNHTIRKITPAGVVTTLAGSAGLSGSADGTGSAARFAFPYGVATDSGGNVFVTDTNNMTIRKITPAGVVTTLAGSAGQGGSADGTGSAARFFFPIAVAADSGGNVVVADTFNHTIRRITPAGVVTTLAGSAGLIGSVDGTGSASRFDTPAGVSAGSDGTVVVADRESHTIRRIAPGGVVTTLAGSAGLRGSADGTGSAARFNTPIGVATDSVGTVLVADAFNHTIRKVTPAGAVTTLAGSANLDGSADGTGSAARFHTPTGVASGGDGNFVIADADNHMIRRITPAGVVTTLAGSAGLRGSADGTGSAARFDSPVDVATDSVGNVFVADADNHTIRKITPAGVVTTLAGSAGLRGSADGTGSAARFDGPWGVATDSGGNVFVADRNNHIIRRITPAGVVTTFAGWAGYAGNQDGTGSAARFFSPSRVATDTGGNVVVADADNHTIRKITPAGAVTTLAGLALFSGSEIGTGSAARFSRPEGVATDSSGNVYVADMDNHRIRIGRPALADAATIDFSTGCAGATRRLNTTTQTATSWQWTLIRQPDASAALLSSTAIRNPVFTPDVADLYIFRLTASNGVSTSITNVSLTATVCVRRRAVRH